MEKREPRHEAALCASGKTKSEVWNRGFKERADPGSLTAPFAVPIEYIPLLASICLKCIRLQRALIKEMI